MRGLAVEVIRDGKTPEDKNTAEPYWLDYLSVLIAKETSTPLSEVREMPYVKIMSYVHCIMRINGTDTRWLIADEEQAQADAELVADLLA